MYIQIMEWVGGQYDVVDSDLICITCDEIRITLRALETVI